MSGNLYNFPSSQTSSYSIWGLRHAKNCLQTLSSLHPASATGVIVLASSVFLSVCLCVSLSRPNGQTYFVASVRPSIHPSVCPSVVDNRMDGVDRLFIIEGGRVIHIMQEVLARQAPILLMYHILTEYIMSDIFVALSLNSDMFSPQQSSEHWMRLLDKSCSTMDGHFLVFFKERGCWIFVEDRPTLGAYGIL